MGNIVGDSMVNILFVFLAGDGKKDKKDDTTTTATEMTVAT